MADALPDPFSGSTNLDTTGEVVTCLDNGVMGPKPADGETNIDAWNKRAESADVAEDAADADGADAAEKDDEKDPEATATAHTTLAASRTAHASALRARADLRAKLRAARATARAFSADAKAARDTARQAVADRDTAKASLATMQARAEKAEAHVDADVKRVNAEVARTLASHGHVALKVSASDHPNGSGKTMPRAAFSALRPREQSDFCRSGGKISD